MSGQILISTCENMFENEFQLIGPEFEDFAEPGRGTRVDKEGAFISLEVFPVSATKCWETMHWNEAFITLPPRNAQINRNNKLLLGQKI